MQRAAENTCDNDKRVRYGGCLRTAQFTVKFDERRHMVPVSSAKIWCTILCTPNTSPVYL